MGSAEQAAQEVHRAFRQLEKQHGGGPRNLATLEARPCWGVEGMWTWLPCHVCSSCLH